MHNSVSTNQLNFVHKYTILKNIQWVNRKNYLVALQNTYKTELSENNITIPGTVSELFKKRSLKIPTNTLPVTGHKNNRIEDESNN